MMWNSLGVSFFSNYAKQMAHSILRLGICLMVGNATSPVSEFVLPFSTLIAQ